VDWRSRPGIARASQWSEDLAAQLAALAEDDLGQKLQVGFARTLAPRRVDARVEIDRLAYVI
jgi:hypothetical protein